MTESSNVRLSIGLPVFNAERYLKETLDSILGQTYSDFELIISDNASIDHTEQICRKYAAKDRRIRYYRNRKNLGASKNFNQVFELSSGEYFKWVADDDVHASDFLLKCVSVLDRDPSIVLCHSKTGRIDEHGALVGAYDYNTKIDSRKPHERFGGLINYFNPVWIIFGVTRASALRKTSLIGNYMGADRALLAEISLLGRIYVIPEYLFFRRKHPQAYSERVFLNKRERLAWWTRKGRSSARALELGFPWRLYLEYLRCVRRVSLNSSERLLCYEQIARWFISQIYKFYYERAKLHNPRC